MAGGTTRIERLRSELGLSKVSAASSRAALGDGAEVCPPSHAPSPDPGVLDLAAFMIPADALGRIPPGPLWGAFALDQHQTLVVGPGIAFPLCAAGLEALHAAISAARKERGLC